MIELTPKIYKQRVSNSLLSENKINTVNIKALAKPNSLDDNEVVCTEEVTTVQLGDIMHTLPISMDTPPTHFRSTRNYRWGGLFIGNKEYAKARMECILVSGKTKCKVATPLVSFPEVKVTLNGKSKIVERSGSSYNLYPSMESLQSSESIANWINDNKTEQREGLVHDYSGSTFSMNPWVRNIVPVTNIGLDGSGLPTSNDIITLWSTANAGRSLAAANAWTEYGNFDFNNYNEFTMYTEKTVNFDIEAAFASLLRIRNINLPITSEVVKIDDYTYEVLWTVPVRVAYVAASREFGVLLGTAYEVDNYAFLDEVSSILIQLHALPVSGEKKTFSYNLDSNNTLMSANHSNFAFELNSENLLVEDAIYGSYKRTVKAPSKTLYCYISSDGTLKPQSTLNLASGINLFVTTFIPVRARSTVVADYNDAVSVLMQGGYYDENFKFIAPILALNPDTLTSKFSFEIPENVAYICMNGKTDTVVGSCTLQITGPTLWVEYIANALLVKFKEGKYTVECDVSATWALQQKIEVNTEMKIKLLDGTYISRKNTPCVFQVKNIEKKFDQKEFIFTLKLLEV